MFYDKKTCEIKPQMNLKDFEGVFTVTQGFKRTLFFVIVVPK